MKATGIVRRQLKITEGTPMELYTDGNKVVFQKYTPGADMAKAVDDLRVSFLQTEEFYDMETATKIKEHINGLMEIVKESED